MKFLSILLCLVLTPFALAEEVVFNCKFQKVNQNVWFDRDGNVGDLGPGTPVRENVYMVSNGMRVKLNIIPGHWLPFSNIRFELETMRQPKWECT